MPAGNAFRHQVYVDERPQAKYRLARPPMLSPTDGDQTALESATVFRDAGVQAIYLVHGTFTGDDAFGILREVSRLAPDVGRSIRKQGKQMVDRWVGDMGNYSDRFADELRRHITDAGATLPVRRFQWSGENHYLGRADAAVALVDQLLGDLNHDRRKVMLWGHSHAGNVFALVTHLVGAERPVLERFFFAASRLAKSRLGRSANAACWERVRNQLLASDRPQRALQLDLVTFGTPIRYGWEQQGYARLLHIVHHRVAEGWPDYQVPFPFRAEDALNARHGDYIQQLAIAGTNFMPYLFALRSWRVEHALRQLLEGGIRRRDLLKRLRCGMRVARDGTTLLVDYSDDPQRHHTQVLGHAVYTRTEWLPTHMHQVAQQFYARSDDSEKH